MGLGKTLSFFAYIVVERQLAFLWDDVEKSRRDNDRRHFRDDQQGGDFRTCPTEKTRGEGWIVCPCVGLNVTAHMPPKRGNRLAIVPPALVTQWILQWNEHIDVEEKHIGMRLIVAHHPSFAVDSRVAILDARHNSNITALKSKRDARYMNIASQPSGSGDDYPQRMSERILMITTAHEYRTWVEKTFEYEGLKAKIFSDGRAEWNLKERRPGVIWGIVCVDECHDDYLRGKGAPAVIAGLARTPKIKPYVWGYSGTPRKLTSPSKPLLANTDFHSPQYPPWPRKHPLGHRRTSHLQHPRPKTEAHPQPRSTPHQPRHGRHPPLGP